MAFISSARVRHVDADFPCITQCPQTAGWICETDSHRGVGATPNEAFANWRAHKPASKAPVSFGYARRIGFEH